MWNTVQCIENNTDIITKEESSGKWILEWKSYASNITNNLYTFVNCGILF